MSRIFRRGQINFLKVRKLTRRLRSRYKASRQGASILLKASKDFIELLAVYQSQYISAKQVDNRSALRRCLSVYLVCCYLLTQL